MSEKSAQKRMYILETARKVFMEKGFKNVTMKDIVEACDISRGGLYLYFAGTEEIFMEVLKLETEETDDVFSGSIGEDAVPSDILALFLKEQKKELLGKRNNLTIAVYEFFFANKFPKKDHLLKQQFDTAVKIIEKLIEAGVDAGEFYCEDPLGAARNIMYVLEGLKVVSQTRGITEDVVDREVMYIMQGLVMEE
ncbi:TetR family transcriptional regulator [Kineothrix alysoides]|uniref:TetR family transcriptional regulator n=1 Tax=Kineothrix alysoides TaxID=1469948 RepID=A0A4R1R0X8_9FIRM|nr:TetR/AcrR family transcriptional regulator [Kineothrix alysoides]TCL58973.1 TetR family transcriptional regulator [Kineothrix alysoides]